MPSSARRSSGSHSCSAMTSASASRRARSNRGARTRIGSSGSTTKASLRTFQVTMRSLGLGCREASAAAPPTTRTSSSAGASAGCAMARFARLSLTLRFWSSACWRFSSAAARFTCARAIASAVARAASASSLALKPFAQAPRLEARMACVSPLPKTWSRRRRRSQRTISPWRKYQMRWNGRSPPSDIGTKAASWTSIDPTQRSS
mmetsp:Transcript_18922/g.48542  ORF Transcript_18922/g.48542 Transcript_18922/m.48542 type:complete len:205 (+) Transcript_18922:2585-3199(+)